MSATRAYTVFGFGSGLDWKPTVFVNGVPPTRVCGACGLVPPSTATLPCRHALCQTCYDRSADKHKRCPMDKKPFQREDVVWSSFALDSLLARKIRCWNASKGCDTVGPASDILEHFGNECQYQPVTCLRCNKSLIHKDVVDHLESPGCRQSAAYEHVGHVKVAEGSDIRESLRHIEATVSSLKASVECVTNTTSGSERFRDNGMVEVPIVESIQSLDNTLKENTKTCITAASEMMQTRALVQCSAGAIKASIEDLKSTIRELKETQNRLAEESNVFNTPRETCSPAVPSTERLRSVGDELRALRGATSNATKLTRESLVDLPGIRNEVTDKLSLLVNASKAILHNTFAVSEPLKLTVNDWSKLVAKASSDGHAQIFANTPKYFHGYSLLPGIDVKTRGRVHLLSLAFRICKGEYDRLLRWPLEKNIELTIIHPTNASVIESVSFDTRKCEDALCSMPTHPIGNVVRSEQNIDVSYIERFGYVKNDKLSVKFEVLD